MRFEIMGDSYYGIQEYGYVDWCKRRCGIEASLTFNEEELGIFEISEELFAYASLNPSVI